MVDHPVHSPLGASSAERWMNCPGSIALLDKLSILHESDEPDYRRDGTAAHECAAECLRLGQDAWEYLDVDFNNTPITLEMVRAIQVYLDVVRGLAPACPLIIEYGISSPIHPLFYGTVDAGIYDPDARTLYVNDFKYGEGIAVEVVENPQVMYYGYGLLESYPDTEMVHFRIIQPRAFHVDGPVREWSCSADHLREWAVSTLVPAMLRTELDHTLDAGEHCRFCPAKLVCPLLSGLFRAAAVANPADTVQLNDRQLGQDYQLVKPIKFYLKALEEEVLNRLLLAHEVPGTKLVHQKANRTWGPGAEAIMASRFGDAVYSKPEFKSPAQVEALGPQAAELVKEYAFTPQSGLTVALSTARAPAVIMKSSTDTFSAALPALAGDNE